MCGVAEKAQKPGRPARVHVPPVVEVMESSRQPDLPRGFSFMSIRLNPMHRLPEPESGRLVRVPETAYRQGYVLQAAFTATPFPGPADEEDGYSEDDYSR